MMNDERSGEWRVESGQKTIHYPLSTIHSSHYGDVRRLIRDGDLLLFRQRGLIAAAGRGRHSHAGKAAWWGDDLFLLEVLRLAGGRAVTLSSQVRRWPQRYDVYEVNPENRWPEYDRAGATRFMKRLCGCDYGYWNLATAALLHLPLVRHWINPEKEDWDSRHNDCPPRRHRGHGEEKKLSSLSSSSVSSVPPWCIHLQRPPFCSHACAMADRLGGGVDPVKHLADRLTEPADLARSPFYRYRFTLEP